MEIHKAFYDLCVPYNKNHTELSRILAEMFDYGYRTVAIDQIFDHNADRTKSSDIIPAPVDLTAFKTEFKNKLTILSRLTIIYTEPVIAHAMNNSLNLKKYNLVAGSPKSQAAFHHCCSTFAGDIITRIIDDDAASQRINVAHKYYQLALRRGLVFELKYAPAIVDSSVRRETLAIAHTYASQRKAKNVIISSGALTKFQIRGPYDIANLGLIFGLSEEQSKSAISHICRTVLLNAESRRYGKTIMFVRNIDPKKTSKKKKKGEVDDDDDDEDDEDDDEEEESDDDSMDGHPSKKQRIN